jgi:hypothetical protein
MCMELFPKKIREYEFPKKNTSLDMWTSTDHDALGVNKKESNIFRDQEHGLRT